MLVKLVIVLALFYVSDVHTQLNCMQYDFNNIDTANDFYACSSNSGFQFKSYENVSIEPYRNDVENHLTNAGTDLLCMRTKESFFLENTTEIYVAFRFNSKVENDNIRFAVYYRDSFFQYIFEAVFGPHEEWIELSGTHKTNHIRNVTVIIALAFDNLLFPFTNFAFIDGIAC